MLPFAEALLTPPEKVTLPGSVVSIARFAWHFRAWSGEFRGDTYGGKGIVESAGEPVFAEIAVSRLLKQSGFEDAVWVDTYRRKFRTAMPPSACNLPSHIHRLHDQIFKTNNGRRGGCWDVLAWRGSELLFVECKRRGKDQMTDSQGRWLAAALKVGLSAENFAICEWDLSP